MVLCVGGPAMPWVWIDAVVALRTLAQTILLLFSLLLNLRLLFLNARARITIFVVPHLLRLSTQGCRMFAR